MKSTKDEKITYVSDGAKITWEPPSDWVKSTKDELVKKPIKLSVTHNEAEFKYNTLWNEWELYHQQEIKALLDSKKLIKLPEPREKKFCHCDLGAYPSSFCGCRIDDFNECLRITKELNGVGE